MKIIFAAACAFLSAFLIFSILPVNNEAAIYDNMIRLHVIAASDSEADQTLKLRVRDRVFEMVSEKLSGTDDTDAAAESIREMLPEIESAAFNIIGENGYDYSVAVKLDREEYPVRYYEDYRLPAGEYLSLRVIIGEGAGANWWCVLFPPLCTAASKDEKKDDFIAAGFTPEQYKLIQNDSKPKYKIRFRMLEILSDVFGFGY